MGRFVHAVRTVERIGRGIDELERVEPFPAVSTSRSDVMPVAITTALGMIGPSAVPTALEGGAGVPPAILEDLPQAPIGDLEESAAVRSTLPEVEDRRLFHPDYVNPLRTLRNNAVRLQVAPPIGATKVLPAGVAVKAKDHVLICIRRKSRRGVLVALGQAGGFHRPPRRSPTSDIWC